nr:hypothetical protein [Streptomyces sp. A1499]
MLDEVIAVAAVDPDLAQAGVGVGRLLEESAASGGVLDAVAAVTITASSRTRVSAMMLRLRPTISLPASMPWLQAGTEVDVFTTVCVDHAGRGVPVSPFLLA